MSNVWQKQNELLGGSVQAKQNHVGQFARNSLITIERNSAALQKDALLNDEPHPLLAVRLRTKEIRITMRDGDKIFAGDYIEAFNERWLVVEKFIDEHGIRFARAWLCNVLFRFQNGNSEIHERRAVLDDGTYVSSQGSGTLPLEQGRWRVYLPHDEATHNIFVDKRFAIGKEVNQKLEEILTVIKIVFIDRASGNLSEGDHLLKLRMENDVFNRQNDCVENMICNFIEDSTITVIGQKPLVASRRRLHNENFS